MALRLLTRGYFLLLLSFLAHFENVILLIPTVCLGNATTSGICCPSPKWSEHVCGGPHRGRCTRIAMSEESIPFVFTNDERTNWPIKFFHTLCECKDNFFGVSCETCFYGWSGKFCDKKHTILRRNVLNMSPKDKEVLIDVIDRSLYEPTEYSIYIEQHNARSDPLITPQWITPNVQYLMVYNHRFGSRATLFSNLQDCNNFGFLDFNHNSIGFLTWHRYFNLIWERLLQKIAKKYHKIDNFALPYWDWTDATSCEVCTNDIVGAEGRRHPDYGVLIDSRSPFSNWTEYCVEPLSLFQCYGCHKAGYVGRISRTWNNLDFPKSSEIEFILGLRNFYVENERLDEGCQAFHRAVEGLCGLGIHDGRFYMHNRLHNMIDGSMCCSASSPSDPLFLLHHIQIDRLFEAWISRYHPTLDEYPDDRTRPGHGKYSNLVSWIPLIKHADMFKSSKYLGYKYDNFLFGKSK